MKSGGGRGIDEEGKMRDRGVDWTTALATAGSIVGSIALFISLYVAVSLPVAETLARL